MLKYPWEQELEEVEARDKAAENTWKNVAKAQKEEMGKYGLEYWVYFEAVRSLSWTFLAMSVLAVPNAAFFLQGSVIQQSDVFAWAARLSLGNVDRATRLHLGFFTVSLGDSPILGLLDALQLAPLLLFLLYFRFIRLPALIQNPELRTLSAADYALQVEGLPPRLPDAQANQKYDFELLRHFEAVLRSLPGAPPNAMVCEVALARSYGSALLLAEERSRVEAELVEIEESARPVKAGREEKLRARHQQLSKELLAKRVDEAERPVRRAYVILGSEGERRSLLRAYRLARLPLLGRLLQRKHLRFEGKWALRLKPAPEPADIIWAHGHVQRGSGAAKWGCLLPAMLLLPLPVALVSLVLWWQLLGTRGAAATQCSPAAGVSQAPCLLEGGEGWGCDCICLPPTQWRSGEEECRMLEVVTASSAVAACWLLAELWQLLLALVVPRVLGKWRTPHVSDVERLRFALEAATRFAVPLMATVGMVAWKALLEPPAGFAAPLLWELDVGWFMHAAPVALLWCLARWLSPVVLACMRCCCSRGPFLEPWHCWACLSAVVALTATLMPLLPCLAPLASLGLALRFFAERRLFLKGHAVDRTGTATSTVVRQVRMAFHVTCLAVAAGAALGVWAQGQGTLPDRALKGAGLPCTCILVVALLLPLITALVPTWNGGRRKSSITGPASLNFQEAWLLMRHSNTLASYQIHEHPSYKGGALFRELQPDFMSIDRDRPAVPSAWSRNVDTLPSLALVGDKAPTRAAEK